MKLFAKYFIISVFILGLTNCSSSFFTLSPDEESSFDMGREIIEKEDNQAYSSIAFEDYTGHEFVFHVFVYNKEEKNIVFDPAMVYTKLYDKNKKQISNNIVYAIDPEKQIDRLNGNIEERKNAHDVSTGLNFAFALLNTIVDLTDDNDNDTEEVLENVVVLADNQINEEISYDNDIEYLKANKSHWKNEVLRKTNLSKEEGVDGIIYIPLNTDAKYIKVFVAIGRTIHTYKFQQIEKKDF